MKLTPTQQSINTVIERLKAASWKEREAIKRELQDLVESLPDKTPARDFLETAQKNLPLELRWEIEEVLEAVFPPPAPAAKEPPPKDDPKRQLSMADLNLVYDDPRGLMLYKAKTADRWFAVQPDPATGQSRMFELHPSELSQIKAQLKGSPYWVLGAGAAPS